MGTAVKLETFYIKNDDGTYSPIQLSVIDDCLTFSPITEEEIEAITACDLMEEEEYQIFPTA